ncbi:sugar ABC transporter ATP-binding protein [soil metagenome]
MSNVLAVRRLSKTFPGQLALDDVDIAIGAGRTHALVGQNGSGKSTFIKILAGYHQPDPGAMAELAGAPLVLGDGRAARDAGVRFVHQDLGLVDTLNAIENISMGAGYTLRRGRRIDWRADRARAETGLSSLGFTDIDVSRPVGALAPSQKTAVALARALHQWEESAHLLVLDEPTASLPGDDVGRLFDAIRILKARGVAILYVSHHLDEVFEIADDVSVLRDGRHVATRSTSGLDHDSLIELMIGHRLERTVSAAPVTAARSVRLEVRGLRGGSLRGVDFGVSAGEVVGVAGITGSGRELLAPFITGQLPSDAGNVLVDGIDLPNYDPRAAIRAGMAFVPADRVTNGIIPLASVIHNLTLGDVGRNWRGGRLRHSEEAAECDRWVARLDVRAASTAMPIAALSGGNQQKVMFGRGLRLEPSVLVLDEPTSGVDVAAKDQIMALVANAARDGAAVVVVSTDTDELVQVAHRVLVVVDGVIAVELTGADLTAEHVEHAQLLSSKAASR